MSGAGEIEVRPVAPSEYPGWDAFAESSPQGTVFQTSAWKLTLEAVHGPDSCPWLGAFHQGELVGGCTFLARRRWCLSEAVTPLLTPYAGYLLPAAPGEKISGRVTSERKILTALAREMARRFGRENLICAPGLCDSRPLSQSGYSVSPRFTYRLDLSLPSAEIWKRLEGHTRRQINKAGRENFEPCALDAARAFELFQGTFERQSQTSPVSRRLFDAVVSGAPLLPFREIAAVAQDGRLASFVVLLRFAGVVHYAIASTAPESISSGVSSLLIWRTLDAHAAAGDGIRIFDFVGANIPSIARFKEGFNPELTPFWRLERSTGTAGHLVAAAARIRAARR